MRTPASTVESAALEATGRERPLLEGRRPRSDAGPRSVLHKRPATLDRQKFTAGSAFDAFDVPAAKSARPHALRQADVAEPPSMEYRFPRLPRDTAQRMARFSDGERVDAEVAYLHGHESRPLLFGWRPFNDPFGRDADAPAPVLDRDAELLNPGWTSGGPFYGRYVGPAPLDRIENGPPLTPVDKAAYLHDSDYGAIYDRYQYSEFEHGLALSRQLGTGDGSAMMLGWMGSHLSLDPAMQLELAWADAKLIGGSWAHMGEGLFKGFYSGRRGENALITDLAWAAAITVTYGAIAVWRLGMVGVGIGYQLGRGVANAFQGLGDTIGGDVGKLVSGIGRVANGALDVAAAAFAVVGTAAFAVYVAGAGLAGALVGGIVYVGGKALQAIGDAVGDAAEWVGDRVGCFITEAVVSTTAEPDDGLRLQTLRAFRDEYVASTPGGRRLLLTYIEQAPLIVAAIDARADRLQAWEEIRLRWIDPSVRAIREGRKAAALSLYIEMVESLSERCGVTLGCDGARSHWKRDPRMAIC